MGNISILDCTLRDGGYINDWNFGKDAIEFILKKLSSSNVEFIEVGFIKNQQFDGNKTVFPDIKSISEVIKPKKEGATYVGMIDMNDVINPETIPACSNETIDAIRVIFKQDRVKEGYSYVKKIMELGYKTMVQLVSTNTYTEEELVDVLKLFSELKPYAIYIVDSLGVIKRKAFLRMVELFDKTVDKNVALGYHSHNNLQQARGNAESLVDLNLSRDVIIDASVYGMGRGAGNLNMELFMEFMNEYYDKNYKIEPTLEIIDEYLNDIYQKTPWGYSLPYYLSASNGCHPNYAKYYYEKGTLTEKAFNELLKTIPDKNKPIYSKTEAEKYYQKYMENYIDDRSTLKELSSIIENKKILVLGPGNTLNRYKNKIKMFIEMNEPVVISLNFYNKEYSVKYIFSSNMRRYRSIQNEQGFKKIITSNIKDASNYDYMVNYSSYCCDNPDVMENSGLMLLRLLQKMDVKEVFVAGLDGYEVNKSNYYDSNLNANFEKIFERNQIISDELKEIEKNMIINFITPTVYQL